MRNGYRLSPYCAHDSSDFCQSCYIGADGFTDSERMEYNSPKNIALRAVDDFFVMLGEKAHQKDIAQNGPNEELSWRSLHDVPLTMNEILKVKLEYYKKIGVIE
jgi:hypothetical protein